MKRRLRPGRPEQASTATPASKSQTDLKKDQFSKADAAKIGKHTLEGTPTKPKPPTSRKVTRPKKVDPPRLNLAQLDALGLRIAGLPLANKDKDILVGMLIDELKIKDTDRFFLHVRETNVPTPKT
jgi:hypothetical protein